MDVEIDQLFLFFLFLILIFWLESYATCQRYSSQTGNSMTVKRYDGFCFWSYKVLFESLKEFFLFTGFTFFGIWGGRIKLTPNDHKGFSSVHNTPISHHHNLS